MCDLVLAVATGNTHKIREIQAVLGPLGIRVLTAAEAGAPEGFSPEENGATFEENSRIKALALLDAIAAADAVVTDVAAAKATTSDAAATGVATAKTTVSDAADAGAWSGIGATRIDGVIADDSGLCVDALGGAPGVYSARFADMPPSSPAAPRNGTDDGSADSRNNAKLLSLLDGVPDAERTARFVCVVTLILPRGGSAGKPVGDAGGAIRETVCRGECEGRILASPRGSSGFGYDPVFVPTDAVDVAYATDSANAANAADAMGTANVTNTPDAANTVGQGGGRSFAEMAPDEKNAISHRARALAKLRDALSESA